MGFWIVVGYLILLGTITHGINQLVTLKKENIALLREILKRMDNKNDIESVS